MLVSGAKPIVASGLRCGSAARIICGSRKYNTASTSATVVAPGRMMNSIGPRATDAVQHRVEQQILVLRLRFAQPPIGEDGEFLRPARFAAIQRQAAGREAIDLAPAQQAEITGSLESAQFVPFVGRIERVN